MKALSVLIFVIGILIGLFFSLYNLFRLVFISVGQGFEGNFGNVLTSPPSSSGDFSVIIISALLAGVFAVIIIIFEAAREIIKRKKN